MSWRWLPLLSFLPLTAAAQVQVWATSSLVKLDPDAPPPADRRTPQPEVCRGEVAAWQIVVHSEVALEQLRVEPFRLRLDESWLEVTEADIYREQFVRVEVPSGNDVREPRRWPDALVPQRHLAHSSLAAGETAVFWLDAPIPPEVPFGDYTGTCEVVADGRRYYLPLRLTVVDITLPRRRHARANVAVYYDDLLLDYANRHWRPADQPWTRTSPEFVDLKRRYFELLLDHRLCAYDLPVAPTSPAAEVYYRDERVHSIRLPWLHHGEATVTAAVAAARAAGAGEKLYYYQVDEPQPAAYAETRALAEQLRRVAPGVPFVVTTAPVEELLGAVDIWAPNLGNFLGLGYLDPAWLEARRERGEGSWWYTCCVPLAPYPTWLVDDAATAPRLSGWLMQRYGWDGFVYSMAHGWGDDPYRSTASYNQTNGDGLLLYPGQPYGTADPFPSFRLKQLRDGLQDWELLRLLAIELDAAARRRGWPARGTERVRELCGELIDRPWRVTRDPQRLLAVRRAAIGELLAARAADCLTRVVDGQIEGVVRPGETVRVKGRPRALGVGRDGAWWLRLEPGQRLVELEIGAPPVAFPRWVGEPWPPLRPAPAEVRVAAAPVVDEALWEQAEPLDLPTGERVRFARDDDALWIRATGAARLTVVLDPGRTHTEALTFVFDTEARRAARRTATGRASDHEPAWRAEAVDGGFQARLPFAALGRRPVAGEVWGATVIADGPTGRTFWFDHHGDLRELPALRF